MRGKIFILVKDKDVAMGMLQHLYSSLTRFLFLGLIIPLFFNFDKKTDWQGPMVLFDHHLFEEYGLKNLMNLKLEI